MLDEKTRALLGDREAQEAITARGAAGAPFVRCRTQEPSAQQDLLSRVERLFA